MILNAKVIQTMCFLGYSPTVDNDQANFFFHGGHCRNIISGDKVLKPDEFLELQRRLYFLRRAANNYVPKREKSSNFPQEMPF